VVFWAVECVVIKLSVFKLSDASAALLFNRFMKNPGKVQGQAQPYDPQYTQYFEQRRCFAWRVR
jgi:hypothetical protein